MCSALGQSPLPLPTILERVFFLALNPRRKYLPFWGALLVGGCIAVLLWYGVRLWEHRLLLDDLAEVADIRTNLLEDDIIAALTTLHSLDSFVRARPNLTREEFRIFVEDLLRQQPEVTAFSWNPLLKEQELSTRQISLGQGIANFHISDWVRDGVTGPPARRSEYFPIEFIEPEATNQAAFGFDPTSEPRRHRALMQAREDGVQVATPPLRLVQENGAQEGILVGEPVFSGLPLTAQERIKNTRGFVVAVFRVGDLVSQSLLPVYSRGISVTVRDSETGQLLYQKEGPGKGVIAQWSRSLTVGQRAWSIDFTASHAFTGARGVQWEAWGTLAAALAITFLIASHFWKRAERDVIIGEWLEDVNNSLVEELETRRLMEMQLRATRDDLEVRVQERTAQLGATNSTLHREVQVRKEAEARAESASQAKSDFLAILSHEIRSPVGGMVRLLNLMLEDVAEPGPELVTNLELLRQASSSLYTMVEELLSWSRVEAGGVALHVTTVRLALFMEDLERLFQPTAKGKGLAFAIQIAPQVPAAFQTDPLALRQILANLLANAFKFTSHGQVTLSVRGVGTGGKKMRLAFVVGDTGIGIPADAIHRLFEPYHQANPSITQAYGGSGLGLSISIRLAELLGGTITVESTPGSGSTFELQIEVEEAVESEIVKTD